MHYKRWKTHGHTNPTRLTPNSQEVCLVESCTNSFWANGYCRKHYHRLNRYGDPLAGPADRTPEEKLTTRIKQQAQRYGLKYETLLAMYKQCNYSCMSCGNSGDLVVDHDHACCNHSQRKCGKCVRGLLCSGCNNFAGYLEMNPERAELVAVYLASQSTGT